MKKILFTILLIPSLCFSQENQTQKKSIFKKIYGQAPHSSVIFMPLGHHILKPDIITPWYLGVNYKSFEISGFKNSQNKFTTAIFYKRMAKLSQKYSLIYGVGLAYGYDGFLKNVRGLPFRETLFAGPITPMVGLEFNYTISKKISLNLIVAPPVVLTYGIRYKI